MKVRLLNTQHYVAYVQKSLTSSFLTLAGNMFWLHTFENGGKK